MAYLFFIISALMASLILPAIFNYSATFLGFLADYGVLFYTSFSYAALYLPLYFFTLGFIFLKCKSKRAKIIVLNLTLVLFTTIALLLKIILTNYSKMSYIEQQIVLLLGEGAPLVLFAFCLVEILILWKLYTLLEEVDSNLADSIDYGEENIPHATNTSKKKSAPVRDVRVDRKDDSFHRTNISQTLSNNDYIRDPLDLDDNQNEEEVNTYSSYNDVTVDNKLDYEDFFENETRNQFTSSKNQDFSFLDSTTDHNYVQDPNANQPLLNVEEVSKRFSVLSKPLASSTVESFRNEYANDGLYSFDDELEMRTLELKRKEEETKKEQDLLDALAKDEHEFSQGKVDDYIVEKESVIPKDLDNDKYKEDFSDLSYRVHDFEFDKRYNNTALDPNYVDEVRTILEKHHLGTGTISSHELDTDEIDKMVLQAQYENKAHDLQDALEVVLQKHKLDGTDSSNELSDDEVDKIVTSIKPNEDVSVEPSEDNDNTNVVANKDEPSLSDKFKTLSINRHKILSDEEEQALNSMANDIAQSNREEAHISAILSDVNRDLDSVLRDNEYHSYDAYVGDHYDYNHKQGEEDLKKKTLTSPSHNNWKYPVDNLPKESLPNETSNMVSYEKPPLVALDDFNPLDILTDKLNKIESSLQELSDPIVDEEAYLAGAIEDQDTHTDTYNDLLDDIITNKSNLVYDTQIITNNKLSIKPVELDDTPSNISMDLVDRLEPKNSYFDDRDSSLVMNSVSSNDRFQDDEDDSIIESDEIIDENEPYLVPVDGILDSYESNAYWEIDEATQQDAYQLENTLKEFNIDAKVIAIRKGPVVTMFEILPSAGVKLSKIEALSDNITFRLAANSVRIVAPIPGKQAVGIEVPNRKRSMVAFSDLIDTPEMFSDDNSIPIALGKDIEGKSQVIDLTKTPHLLIAGSTGSGKSVCVNSIICSILYTKRQSEVKLMLIDPKVVELKPYNDVPHLLTPVITEPKRALQAVQWTMDEMERRYSLMDGMNAKNIKSYNKKIKERRIATEKLPYIVLIIDEFADLMASCGKELEINIARLAAKSRAAGIHLILATQRPSADVITGLIKANFPSRIAFKVASKIDSRIILDMGGADQLLGRGDMLFISSWNPFAQRMQSPFLSEEEVDRITDYVRSLGEPDYIDEEIFIDEIENDRSGNLDLFSDDDPLFDEAIDIVVEQQKASASYLQRRLKIGYNRAARLVEMMEERNIVGPANGSKAREVLKVG